MEFFVDTADVQQIKRLNDMGLVDGVTTNPSLIKKAGKDHETVVKEILSFIKGPVSVETIDETAEGMVKDGIRFSKWAKNVVVKIPMNAEGMKAVRKLSDLKIKTNVTLVFSPLQALIAAKAGATYVSPFVGRLDDIGESGMGLIEQIHEIFKNYSIKTKILVASVRSPTHILEAALIGADVSTVPPDVMLKLFSHPLTDSGIKTFLEDAKQWKK
ncbi:MAG: fructose-6-phosphate aldolase [Candidatus Woesearchaeota archaeon]|nr:fructose-6-phosphate aldolase [Candidatus Woesearchaeota archaeon]